jgi:hypothetical protein
VADRRPHPDARPGPRAPPPGRRPHLRHRRRHRRRPLRVPHLVATLDAKGSPTGTSATPTGTSATSGGTSATSGGTSGTSGGTSSRTGTGSSEDLLSPAGVRKAIAAFRPVFGTKVVDLIDYGQYVIADAPVSSDKTDYDRYQYRDGEVTDIGPGGSVDDSPLIDVDSVDWDVVPALLTTAGKKLEFPKPTMRYVYLRGDLFSDKPSLYIYLVNDYDAAFLESDLEGHVTALHPRGS